MLYYSSLDLIVVEALAVYMCRPHVQQIQAGVCAFVLDLDGVFGGFRSAGGAAPGSSPERPVGMWVTGAALAC